MHNFDRRLRHREQVEVAHEARRQFVASTACAHDSDGSKMRDSHTWHAQRRRSANGDTGVGVADGGREQANLPGGAEPQQIVVSSMFFPIDTHARAP